MHDSRFAEVLAEHDALEARFGDPAVMANPDLIRQLGQDLARLGPTVEAIRRLEPIQSELAAAQEMVAAESDPEMIGLARAEVADLEGQENEVLAQLHRLLVPRDPSDERDAIMEIRAGAGGDEAALFAGDLARMYLRYAERMRYKCEILSSAESGDSGFREIIIDVRGKGAYGRLKFEGGVHRVQRVPATESAGRIHTSTATVAVLLKAEDVDLVIDPKDLRMETKRASGPGGQSVNKTDSCVRITHVPTGVVVEIQDEKSQHKNKAKALSILRSRVLEIERQRAHEAEDVVRRGMVGSGDRAEKIRTYNTSQDRISDHRIGLDLHNLPAVMAGDLDALIDALTTADEADRLDATLDER